MRAALAFLNGAGMRARRGAPGFLYGPDVLPAIALTAFARSEDRIEALAAGFQGHLVKPLDPQTLISQVASLRRPAGVR